MSCILVATLTNPKEKTMKRMTSSGKIIAATVAMLIMNAMAGNKNLETGFKAPPDSAKPHTWFHMMNGNVTK